MVIVEIHVAISFSIAAKSLPYKATLKKWGKAFLTTLLFAHAQCLVIDGVVGL